MKVHGALIGAGTLALLAGLAVLDTATGQERDPAQPAARPADRPDAQRQPGEPGAVRPEGARASESDKLIATWVALIDHCEITLGQEAAQKATNPQVKQFAERMVNDHKQSLQKLSKFGVDATATLAASEGRSQDRAAGFRPDDPQSRPADPTAQGANARPAGDLDVIMLKREIAQNTLKASLAELRSKQGADFDKCYIGHQVMAHMEAVHVLEALSKRASPELREVLQQDAQAVKHHLDEAKQLAMTLEGRTGSGVRPSTDPSIRPGSQPGIQPGTRPGQPLPGTRPGTQPQPGRAQPDAPR